jgi:hypothetical protein
MIKFILLLGLLVMESANAKPDVCSLPVSELLSEVVNDVHFDEQIPSQLMLIRSFIALKVCAPVRWQEYLKLVPKVSKQKATVLIYTAQSLKGKSYLDFGKGLIKSGNNPTAMNNWLSLFLFPGYDWNTELVENHTDPSIVSFLELSKSVLVNQHHDIDEIISGDSLKSLINSRINQRTLLNSF